MAVRPSLGVLLLDTAFPRIPGDVGNAQSYNYPIVLKTVPGATVQRIIYEADASLQDDFIRAARELELQGVSAITSSCGFLIEFQEAVAAAVRVPVFLSSLMQVPLVYALTQRQVGIITAHSEKLTGKVLSKAGISDRIPFVAAGMQNSFAFSNPILQNGISLDKSVIEQDMVDLSVSMLDANPDLGSFVLECHNLAPYAQAVGTRTGLPVFDIIDFANWVYNSVNKRAYPHPDGTR
ncbi:MAG: aspartate/glutamate racemase family protein [Chloroflexota bacterium]